MTLKMVAVRVGRKGALALGERRPFDLVVRVVQKGLKLLPPERPRLGVAFVVAEMGDGVPLVAYGHRVDARAEGLLADSPPSVAGVDQVLAEHVKVDLVAADRRRRQVALRDERHGPFLHVHRSPVPGVLVGDLQEPAHQPLSGLDRVGPQPTSDLLSSPTTQHRLEHRVLGAQLRHARHKLKMCRTCEIPVPPSLPVSRLEQRSCI